MSMNLDNVVTGYVTTSIRDAHMDGLSVKKGDYIGLDDKHIQVTGNDRLETVKALISKLMSADAKDVVIVFYGEDVSNEEVVELEAFLQDAYPLVDLGFIDGKQSVYDFIISLE